MLNSKIPHHRINVQAIEVCAHLCKQGHQAFIVGGCVRDLLLGLTPKDWDICTDASPQQVIQYFPKTIPTGLQHGTVTVVMGPGTENHFEVTTFRIEGEYKDGRRPEEVFFVMNVEQDLARRDLTINALAYDPLSQTLIDPFNGLQDLQNGIIRAVGNANSRFQEDGLRIMRVARFASRFTYSVDEATFNGMQSNLDTLKKVSKERIKDELCKTLMSKNPSFGMQILQETKVLEVATPLLSKNSENSISKLNNCNGELETKLAFLYGSNPIAEVNKELLYLKFSNKEIKKVIFLLQLLERYSIFHGQDTVNSYKSFMALVINHAHDSWTKTLEQFIQLTEALGLGSKAQFQKYSHVTVISRKNMELNGDDILEAGLAVGPEIKNALDKCYLEILRNPEHNTKAFLLDFIKNS